MVGLAVFQRTSYSGFSLHERPGLAGHVRTHPGDSHMLMFKIEIYAHADSVNGPLVVHAQ